MNEPLRSLYRVTLLSTFLWVIFAPLLLAKDATTSVRVFLPVHHTCATHVQKYERHHGMPMGLLHAISKAESGLKDIKGQLVAWPWTINARGQGYFFSTKEDAIAAVQALQAKGIKNIDVGCMQVNLYHHPNAFKTLEDAFEPSKNVAYAARFLTSLKKDLNCWRLAAAHYHSANPIHNIPYQRNVLRIWNRDNKAAGRALAEGIIFQRPSSRTLHHVRRLGAGKTLKLARGKLMQTSNNTTVSRRVGGGHTSHIRRLKLSKR